MAIDTKNDPRAAERSAGVVVPVPVHGHTVVVPDLTITVQQVNDAASPVADAAKQAVNTINPFLQPETQQRKPPRARPGTRSFILAMANVQEQFSVELGQLTTSPDAMRQRVAVADAADTAGTPVINLGQQLTDIANISLAEGFKSASAVYKRAVALSATNAAVAKLIAPYREAKTRQGKKAAATRKKKKAAEQQQAAAAPQAEPPQSTTATITTTH